MKKPEKKDVEKIISSISRARDGKFPVPDDITNLDKAITLIEEYGQEIETLNLSNKIFFTENRMYKAGLAEEEKRRKHWYDENCKAVKKVVRLEAKLDALPSEEEIKGLLPIFPHSSNCSYVTLSECDPESDYCSCNREQKRKELAKAIHKKMKGE